MIPRLPLILAASVMSVGLLSAETQPLKALLIAGGCCHDYANQHVVLSHGLQERANMQVDVIWSPSKSPDPYLPIFKDPDWAKGYDLVIHDECAALNTDEESMTNIINTHKTTPAVHLHCAMHSFRGHGGSVDAFTAKLHKQWRDQIGLLSVKHGPHKPISVELTNPEHPITKPLQNWVTTNDELYHVAEVYDAEPLAIGNQTFEQGGKQVTDTAIVVWTNTKHGAPSFSTSLGHYTDVVASEEYLTLVTRGSLWACGKLDDPAYQTAFTGQNVVTEIESQNKPAEAKLSASSTQVDLGNYLHNAVDGDEKTRWCAESGKMPAWYQIEFTTPQNLGGIEIQWEIADQWMQYQVEVSADGKTWEVKADQSKNGRKGVFYDRFRQAATGVRFVKITSLAQERQLWSSIREIEFTHTNGDLLPIKYEGADLLSR